MKITNKVISGGGGGVPNGVYRGVNRCRSYLRYQEKQKLKISKFGLNPLIQMGQYNSAAPFDRTGNKMARWLPFLSSQDRLLPRGSGGAVQRIFLSGIVKREPDIV